MSKRLGIYLAERLTSTMSGLIFRSQPEGSTGLNAHLETDSDRVIGIKLCESVSCEHTARGYICTGETSEAAYWFQHSLPVLFMVYESERNRILCESVTPESLELSGRNYELLVPYESEYDSELSESLKTSQCLSPYLARLALSKSWMELLASGQEIYLELDEWMNQPSEHGSVRLCTSSGIYQWPFRTSPDMPQVLCLPSLFPWANLHVDEDYYRTKNLHDPEHDSLVPYAIESGEIARFRFRLELNSLGHAFLAAESYICRGDFPVQYMRYGSEYESSLKYMLYHQKNVT